ncbi:MAG: MarR family winged helix-turn-helix transcriptional regulator [Candidatus Pacebacteria bacterium]|nr:MarR family winged helix-turn-helix transcriptional regulator [Candidatus Paceibacterota bacterium]
MKQINNQLKFFIILAEAYAKIAQTFDKHLLGGLGFNDLIILYHLGQAPDEKMRRIDLAEKVGLTPSGVTRMLLPMEKLGMVKREASELDARVSYVKLAPGGKRLLTETLEEAEFVSEELLPSTKLGKMKDVSEIFSLFSFGKIN